jgi:hypothetical protein
VKHIYIFKLIFIFTIFSITINLISDSSMTYTGTVVPLYTSDIQTGADANYWGSLNFAAR